MAGAYTSVSWTKKQPVFPFHCSRFSVGNRMQMSAWSFHMEKLIKINRWKGVISEWLHSYYHIFKTPFFFLRLQFWSLSAAGCHTGMFSLSKNHLHFLPFHSLILSWWLMMVAFVHISFRWQGYFCSYMYFITSICTTVRYKDLHSKCINLSLLKYKTSSCHLTHFQFRII